MNRLLMTRILELLLLLVVFFGSDETVAAEKIRIAVSGGYNMIFLSSGVAQHRGFFQDEGLDADIVVMGASPSIAALINGVIDFTLLTGTVIRAAIRGLPVRLVAVLMTSSPHVLLATPGDQIRQGIDRKESWPSRLRRRDPRAGKDHSRAQRCRSR